MYQHQGSQQKGGGGGQQHPDFFQSVNPQMLNLGVETTSNMFKSQRDKYMPGVSSFWQSLKFYFMVNNSYVQKKLLLLMFPFKTTNWSRISSDDAAVSLSQVSIHLAIEYTVSDLMMCVAFSFFMFVLSLLIFAALLVFFIVIQDEGSTHKWLPPKYDVNAPDLYIPCMAFSTYILLVGFSNGQSNKFTPEALIQAVYSCLIFQVFETFIIKFGLSTLLQVHLPFLDLYSYTGYKYVGLCFCMLSSLLGTSIYFLFSVYTSISVSFFVLKSMAMAVPASNVNSGGGGPPRHLVLLGFAATQLIVNFTLCYL